MSAKIRFPKAIVDALRSVNPAMSRRSFVRSSGALVLTLGVNAVPGARALAQAVGAGPYPDRNFLELDTWIVIHPDNTATFFVGKTDGGQGTGTAFRQMMCDELDLAYDRTRLVMGSTDVTPDQGGSGGSDGVERDGWPMRRVSAEARRVLVELASERLGSPVADLAVDNGVISSKSNASTSVTYADLVGGKRFDVALTGRNVDATTGTAAVKPVQDLRVVGKSIPRYDIPAKVDGSLTWAVDVKVPGMLHARNVRPPVAGATLRGIDESSVASIPGFVRVVHRGKVATTSPSSASARSRPSRLRGSSKRNGHHPRRLRSPPRASCSISSGAQRRRRAMRRASRAIPMPRSRAPRESSKRNTRCRFKGTLQSAPHTRSPIHRTVR